MSDQPKYLNIEGVCNTTTLSRSVIYKLMDEADFPHSYSIKGISKRVVWLESEVLGWLAINVVRKAA